jgi:hypothetical protein
MKTSNSIFTLIVIAVVSICASVLVETTASNVALADARASDTRSLAQHTPEKGSVERKAITDALRVPVEKKLKQSVVFNIDHLMVQDDWAFLLGAPRKPGGGSLDYSKTTYAEAQRLGMFDDNISALLHKVRGRWIVLRYVIGATDVVYLDWDKQYHAPAGIFPH